jgi:hypothetical protein
VKYDFVLHFGEEKVLFTFSALILDQPLYKTLIEVLSLFMVLCFPSKC